MKYFLLETLGDTQGHAGDDFCFTDTGPKGGITAYNLKTANRLSDENPDGVGDVTLRIGEDYPGLELPSFIGNTHSLLIVDLRTAALIQRRRATGIESVPFRLLNHKGRVHSLDYVFLNLIGAVDCLNLENSECVLHDDGSIMKYTKFVLSPSKIVGAPDVFRIFGSLVRYVFSEVLVDDLRRAGCTNFIFEELEQIE